MNLFSIYISLVLFYLHLNSLEERSMKMIWRQTRNQRALSQNGHDENSDLSDFSDFARSGPRSDFSSFAQ